MAYQPSAEDFEDIKDNEGYTPSAEDFDQQNEPKAIELTLTGSDKPKELTGWKGLGHDVIQMLRDTLKGGIGFASRAPGNIKEIGSELVHHPLSYPPHVAQQVAASLVGGARDIANVPHRLFDEFANKGITPNWLRTGSIPEDTGVEKLLGLEPTKKSDELIRALPTIFGLGKAANVTRKAFKAPDLKLAIKDTQNFVNDSLASSKKVFNNIEKSLETSGENHVPIRTIKDDVIDKAATYMDKTQASKALIEKAYTGDYKALRKLQASLRIKAEKYLAHDDPAKNDMGREISELRDSINSLIQKHLVNIGRKDLASDLNKVRKNYKDIQDVYMDSPYLAKVFGEEQEVPKNPETLLTKDTAPMTKFYEKHPELKEALEKHLRRKRTKKTALGVAGIAGIGTASELARKIMG